MVHGSARYMDCTWMVSHGTWYSMLYILLSSEMKNISSHWYMIELTFDNVTLSSWIESVDLVNTLQVAQLIQESRRQTPAFKAASRAVLKTIDEIWDCVETLQESISVYNASFMIQMCPSFDAGSFQRLQVLHKVLKVRIKLAGSLQ